MSLAAIAALLERRIGLDVASLGAAILPAAVAEHRRELGSIDERAYVELLSGRPDLFQALTDRLAVPESWFFRGGALFGFLAREIAKSASEKSCYRVLSLPCSTGEEPYSLAIALHDAGVTPASWQIDGIDLSTRAIDSARRGVFRDFSFRQTPLTPFPSPPGGEGKGVRGIRERHFRPVEGGWRIDDASRMNIEFRVGNLLDPLGWNATGKQYDLVFCRNLLIYFTPAARVRALAELERLVMPGGLLAVGHAEPQILPQRRFRRFGPDGLFLFTVGQTFLSATENPGSAASESTPLSPRRRGVGGEGANNQSTSAPSPPAPLPQGERGVNANRFSRGVASRAEADTQECRPPSKNALDAARQLADAGRLDEALDRCRTHLASAGPSADTYCLLGIILQARGATDEADDAFRKALYLEPEHREALTHSMLLLSRRGDAARAAALRERLARLQPEGDS